MDAGKLLTFALLAFVLIVVPGPSVLFVIGRAVALGRRAALATVAGNAAGVYLQVVLVALGLGLVLERSAIVFTVVKLLGAAYLAWLGIAALRRRPLAAGRGPAGGPPARTGAPRRRAFLDGLVVGATNPKATVFFAAVLPQFVAPSRGPVAPQMLLLGLLFVGIALVSDSAWAVAAGTARAWLARSARTQRALRVGGGVVMLGLAVELALTSRR